MNVILQIFIILLLTGCASVNNSNEKLPFVNLVVNEDKYSLILKHHFYTNFNTNNESLSKFSVKTNLSFNTSSSLSNNGNDNLNIIKGTIDFEIFNKLTSKIVKSGTISSSIITGNVSSLYSINENNNFTKERISIYLASKLYRKILLNIKQSENQSTK